MKCLIVQPGAYGDIILCAPIAEYYALRGYDVYWPARAKFHPTLNKFDYVKPLLLNEDILHEDWLRSDVMKILPSTVDYDLVINMADRGPHPTAQQYWENFEECKYRLAQVPIMHKHKLTWTRNTNKENELYDLVVKDKDYIFCHLESSRNDRAEMPETDLPIVECKEIDGYSIFDWYKVIVGAKDIYCVESSIHQFLDGIIPHIKDKGRYLLSRSTLARGQKYTYSPYWNTDYMK